MALKRNFKVALVGCGVISANHLSALSALESVEVVALCDVKKERAEERLKEFGLNAEIFEDYEEMLDSVKPDSVHVCTPHYLHAKMATLALSRDINVFLEKPMCISREEIEMLLEVEKKSRGRICVCFQNRFNTTTLLAKKLADEDGGALSAYGSVFWNRGESYYTGSDWRGRLETEGGGAMINQAIHTIDLLCYFLGKPERVWATTANHHLKGVIEVEDSSEGMIEFEGGKRGCFYATTAFPGGDVTSVFIRTKNHKIEIKSPYLYLDGKIINESEANAGFLGKECYGRGHGSLIPLFYEALASGKPVPVPLCDAKHAVEIILAAYKSNGAEILI